MPGKGNLRIGGSLLAIAALLVLVRQGGRVVFGASGLDPGATAPALAEISRSYGIEILHRSPEFPVRTNHGVIDGSPAGEENLRSYADLFAAEFSLYPGDLVKRSGLERIVLCEQLSFAGQPRNAIPDFEHDVLYLEVARGSYDPNYMRIVLHHEFFHVLDYKDDGRLYEDPEWAALNAPETQYGDGGRNAQDRPDSSILTDEYPGFLDYYATTGVEEDKAEIFANLIVAAAQVDRRAGKDPVLGRKVERMRDLLIRFCPDADRGFWEKAASLDRSAR